MQEQIQEQALQDAISKACEKCGLQFELKEEQIQCIKEFTKKDVLGILPTGFGKTIIYCLLPNIFDIINNKPSGYSIVLVISPLIALMKDQVYKIQNSYNVAAFCAASNQSLTKDDQEKLRHGAYQIVLASPESALSEGWFRDVLKLNNYRERMAGIIIDEAHCIVEWGADFRPEYKLLAELRSLFCNVNILALTATATARMRKEIAKNLCMNSMSEVTKAANRQNIYYACIKTNADIEENLGWVVQKLSQEQETFPKMIIYCRSIDSCGQIFQIFSDTLQENGYKHGIEDAKNRMFAMFHRASWEWNKEYILEEFRKPDSVIRVVIATVCFGMGIDVPDIHAVIHWGAPKSFETFCQESGRAGRNESQAYSLVYYRGSNFTRDCERTMQLYCTNNKSICRREYILKHFSSEHKLLKPKPLHTCCDVCRPTCLCGNCASILF